MLYIANTLNWGSDCRRQSVWVRPTDDSRLQTTDDSRLQTTFSFGASHAQQAPSGAADDFFCTEFLSRQEALRWLDKSAVASLVTNVYWAHFLSRLFEREVECAKPRQPQFYLTPADFVLRVSLRGGKEIRSIDDPVFEQVGHPDELESRGEIRFYLHFIRQAIRS